MSSIQPTKKANTNNIEIDQIDCHLCYIPNDVLLKIFYYALSLQDQSIANIASTCHSIKRQVKSLMPYLLKEFSKHEIFVSEQTIKKYYALFIKNSNDPEKPTLFFHTINLNTFALSPNRRNDIEYLFKINLPNLRSLSISITLLPKHALETIKLDNLESVSFSSSRSLDGIESKIEDVDFVTFAKNNEKINDLSFIHLENHFTDAGLMGTAIIYRKQLKNIYISACAITDNGVNQLLEICTDLKKISISKSFTSNRHQYININSAIITKFPQLEELDIHQGSIIRERNFIVFNENDLINFGINCPQLKKISMTVSTIVTNNGFKQFFEGCNKLESLTIKGSSFTGESLALFANHCLNCHTLSLTNASITKNDVEKTLEYMTNFGENPSSLKKLHIFNHPMHDSIDQAWLEKAKNVYKIEVTVKYKIPRLRRMD